VIKKLVIPFPYALIVSPSYRSRHSASERAILARAWRFIRTKAFRFPVAFEIKKGPDFSGEGPN
jgi:hypothetical protein